MDSPPKLMDSPPPLDSTDSPMDSTDSPETLLVASAVFELQDAVVVPGLPGVFGSPLNYKDACANLGCLLPVSTLGIGHCCVNHRHMAASSHDAGVSFHYYSSGLTSKERDKLACVCLYHRRAGREVGVPTLESEDIFHKPPWEQPEIFDTDLPTVNDWFFFSSRPRIFQEMACGLQWHRNRGDGLRLEGSPNLDLTRVVHNLKSGTDFDPEMEPTRQLWNLTMYRSGDFTLFCLSRATAIIEKPLLSRVTSKPPPPPPNPKKDSKPPSRDKRGRDGATKRKQSSSGASCIPSTSRVDKLRKQNEAIDPLHCKAAVAQASLAYRDGATKQSSSGASCIPSISRVDKLCKQNEAVDLHCKAAVAQASLAYRDGATKQSSSGASCIPFSRVDKLREQIEAVDLHGKDAVAQAALAYKLYQKKFSGPRWKALVKKGAKKLRLPWESTSVKKPAYSDTLYVAPLIGQKLKID